VKAILEGSVRRAGRRLRISARLVDASDGYERWSDRFDRELSDVFALQEEIAQAIARSLAIQFTSGVTPHATRDVIALELYLKGRFAWNQRTEATSVEAVRYFEQAVARDPQFARACAGLADSYLALPMYARVAPSQAWPNAKSAAQRALTLDASLAEAHTALAYGTMLYEWDWARAETSFQLAIAANPTYSTAHHWYADFLAGRGRLEEALHEMQVAHDLDPVSRITGAELGWILHLNRRREEALVQLDALLNLDPNYAHAHFIRGVVLLQSHEYHAAVAAINRARALGGFYAFAEAVLIYALARGGERVAAQRALGELRERARLERIPPFAFAIAHTGLGDVSAAFDALEKGVEERDELLAENFFDPLFDSLKSDVRYRQITSRLGAIA
ncbi:MAG: hypothetical protein AB1762_13990, partial [Gemmatimonadota bacterium]